jgi:hypothetical protein
MPAGRKPKGIGQVQQLTGSEAARRRLVVFLANLAGELSVEEACATLGLHKSRFFELRRQWLEDSLQTLEPEPAGRPVGASAEGQPEKISETGGDHEIRPPRIASNASGEVGPISGTSENSDSGSLSRIAELEDLLKQARWELRASHVREELAALGLSRPKAAASAQKKTRSPAARGNGERGGARGARCSIRREP